MLVPVVLAGGVGSRLWPVSRAALPKQLVTFPQIEGSLFQNTLQRLSGIADLADPLVVCNEEHRFLVAEQLRQLGISKSNILLEPFGRNTAPAVALAAFAVQSQSVNVNLLVLPSDHAIQDVEVFHKLIETAQKYASDGKMMTFGIVPGCSETGYGYIQKGSVIDDGNAYCIQKFVEKPDSETALGYLESGDYLWNSGMFMFGAGVYLDELKLHAPDIYEVCSKAHAELRREADFEFIPSAVFTSCRRESIDYAVMEKTERGIVIPMDAGWSDLGAWGALWELGEKNQQGNVISGDVLAEGVSQSYIQAQSRLVAAVGMRDAIIVETADAVLVADKARAQSVKQIVDQLTRSKRSESENHTLVRRPWGSYESLAMGEGYQVKHIVVQPGASLSLQSHNHRAEHWTVIKGVALIRCDDKEFELNPNESTFIPLGNKHRLTNNGSETVELIEVQVGDYLGEDDIVRFDDRYGRS
jgi:mannose-1-phosphate guanylyltransferase/mannose-6-phosphate isomerase|tara:strand:- start:1116 stop:2531 length:1416 start_codon:yes stop_codon:yes gene_type:complete